MANSADEEEISSDLQDLTFSEHEVADTLDLSRRGLTEVPRNLPGSINLEVSCKNNNNY